MDKRSFEKQLERETLASERLRVTILAAVLMASLLAMLLLMQLKAELVGRLFQRQLRPGHVLATLAAMLLYELLTYWLLRRQIAEQKLSAARRYVNAFIETSFPTVALLFLAQLYTPAQALEMAPVFGYFLFIALSTLRLSFKLCVFTGTVAALEYTMLTVLFGGPAGGRLGEDLLISLAPQLGKALLIWVCGLVSGFVAVEIRRRFASAFRTLKERDRILDMFGRHVSPAVAEKLLAQKRELTELRYVCVMFLDIRDFTAFSEQRRPEEVVDYLNQLFTFMIEIVNAHHGFINKFLGDGFMAVFGAPISDGNDARNAVSASLEILARARKLVAAKQSPPTRLGIGLHAGKAVTGNVGSALRKEYTIIGDVVNVASRIEALNKQFDSELLVSAEVKNALDGGAPRARARGPVTVKGRAAPVEVYQLA